MHDISARRTQPVRRHAQLPIWLGCLMLVVPSVLSWAPAAQAAGNGTIAQGSARSTRPAPPPQTYRGQGRYRGAQRQVRAQPRYQPSMSGIPQSYFQQQHQYRNQRSVRAPRLLSEPQVPYVIPSYVYYEPQPQPRERVIVVQQPAPQPPPQQPVVVVVPQPVAQQPAAPVQAPQPAAPPAPRLPGTVRFAVEPADAVVYLDDRRIGTGADLRAGAETDIKAGVHVLEVSHPDLPGERLVFGVASSAALEVVVDLTASKPSRRSRLLDSP